MKKYTLLWLLSIVLILTVGCSKKEEAKEVLGEKIHVTKEEYVSKSTKESTPKDVELRDALTQPPDGKEKVKTATLVSVGDVMVHGPQLTRAYNSETGQFSFQSSFDTIQSFIEPSDYAVANLETTFSGKDQGLRLSSSVYYKGYQGYPTFNTPSVLATNIKEAGFDMVTTANNHCYDGLQQGLLSTLNTLDSVGLDHVGTNKDPDSETAFIKDIEGIRVGFFNYTYSTNGIHVVDENKYAVNTFDNYSKEGIDRMVSSIKSYLEKNKDQLDYSIVYIHFGNEYKTTPNSHQKAIVEALIKAGVDAVIGTHPHVLQPMEKVTVTLEDGSTRSGFVFYSLGNFLSSQIYTNGQPYPKDVGMVLRMNLEKNEDEKAQLKSVELVPTWSQWKKDKIRVIPVASALESYEKGNKYNLTTRDYNRLVTVNKWVIPHMNSLWNTTYTKESGFYQFIYGDMDIRE